MAAQLLTALRVELLKVRTTRMWWILLLVMVGYVAMIAAAIALTFGAASGDGATTGLSQTLGDQDVVIMVYTVGLASGYVFPVVLGVLAMTAEYRYQTLTPTFLAEPRRPVVLAAKLLVGLAVGLLFGILAMAAGLAAGAPSILLTGHDTLLGDPQVWRATGQSCLAMALWTGIGVGLGALLRNQIAGVVTIIAFSQLVEPIARFGLGAWDATSDIAKFLPGAAADAMAGVSFYTIGSTDLLLNWWQGALVLLGYTVLFCGFGGWSTLRRDIT